MTFILPADVLIDVRLGGATLRRRFRRTKSSNVESFYHRPSYPEGSSSYLYLGEGGLVPVIKTEPPGRVTPSGVREELVLCPSLLDRSAPHVSLVSCGVSLLV